MEAIMLIDCERCVMRDIACADCVVTALLRLPGQPGHAGHAGRPAEIGEAERRALRVLADAKLVSPLRMREPVARAS
jgi:translation initiation factor RLI1